MEGGESAFAFFTPFCRLPRLFGPLVSAGPATRRAMVLEGSPQRRFRGTAPTQLPWNRAPSPEPGRSGRGCRGRT